MKKSDFIDCAVCRLGVSAASARIWFRYLTEEGLLTSTGARGKAAPHMQARDAVHMALAALSFAPATRVGESVQGMRGMHLKHLVVSDGPIQTVFAKLSLLNAVNPNVLAVHGDPLRPSDLPVNFPRAHKATLFRTLDYAFVAQQRGWPVQLDCIEHYDHEIDSTVNVYLTGEPMEQAGAAPPGETGWRSWRFTFTAKPQIGDRVLSAKVMRGEDVDAFFRSVAADETDRRDGRTGPQTDPHTGPADAAPLPGDGDPHDP